MRSAVADGDTGLLEAIRTLFQLDQKKSDN